MSGTSFGTAGPSADAAGSSGAEEVDSAERLVVELARARSALASGAFARARSHAEDILRRAHFYPSVRAEALMLAGDAAYGMGAYPAAAESYREFLSKHRVAPEAPRAALSLGWAELRRGRQERARRTWMQLARDFPQDPRVPEALILAAEVSSRSGDAEAARKVLDRVVDGQGSGRDGQIARLNRALLSVRQGRADHAIRDLRVLMRSSRTSVGAERQSLLDGLSAPGGEGGPAREITLTRRYDPGGSVRDEDGGAPAAPPGVFQRFAAPFLGRAGDPETTPLVLHGLILMAGMDKAWTEARALSMSLVDRFPAYPAAPGLLASVAERSASADQWAIARASHETLIARYPALTISPRARVNYAEALYRTDALPEARAELARFVETAPREAEAPRALVLLAEVSAALARPRDALAAYERLRRDHPQAEWTAESLLPHARLLQDALGRERDAFSLLEEAVRRTEGDAFVEASFRLAWILSAAGDHEDAVDWFLSAAYGGDGASRWYRLALMGAARSLVALDRLPEAVIAYGKIVPAMPVGRVPERGRSQQPAVADPELVGEAAYRAAEILSGIGRADEALDAYLTAAYLAPESPWGRRALVGAVRSMVAAGDRASAEAIYRRLLASSETEPDLLAQARQALRDGGARADR